MKAKQESQLGYNILFGRSLPQGQFFDMAPKRPSGRGRDP
jgi:hypothetical protein